MSSNPDVVAGAAASFTGDLLRPSDAAYEERRRVHNGAIDRRPAMIARCRGVADVVDAIRLARATGLEVSVRGGGHNVAGRAVIDGALMIDLSLMKGIHVDAGARAVRAQGGVLWSELNRETQIHGLATTGGVVGSTGIAGLTLGGGVGWLVRRHGLSCDNVVSFELVTADGRLLTASAEEHADLFWALRGGGGNFGVVTRFTFRAQPISTVLGGLLVHGRDKAGEVLRFYRDFLATAPEELTAYSALITTPDGMPAVAVIACWCGEIAAGERVLAPLRAFGPPLVDAVQPMPFPSMQALLDGAFPSGTHNYWKASFVPKLTDAAIDLLVEHGNRMESPLSACLVEFYGGAPGRVGRGESAFAQRAAEYNVGMTAQWTDPAESERHIAWVRAMYDAFEPHSSGMHLLNFQSETGDDVVEASFAGNYDRLADVKRKYDPTNFFSLNQNIAPATR